MIPELGWPPCRRHGRGFRRTTCGPLLRVAGTVSSLESVPRRSVRKRRFAPFVRLCSARLPAIVHSSALDRRVSVVIRVRVINLSTDTLVLLCPLRPPGRAPAEAQCESSQLSRVRTTLVPAAHTASWLCASWSVGTQHIRHRVRSLLANIHPNEPLRNVLCSPSCSSRAAPVALITKPLWVRSFPQWLLFSTRCGLFVVGATVDSSLFSTVQTCVHSPASPHASAELTVPVQSEALVTSRT